MSQTLIVLLKSPILGSVKTRLAVEISKVAALNFYEAFLKEITALAKEWSEQTNKTNKKIVFSVTPNIDHPLVRQLALQCNAELRSQVNGDLGQRMYRELQKELLLSDEVCLIGTDSPTMPLAFLEEAFDKLKNKETDLVFGPSRDGGYYLIGSHRLPPLKQCLLNMQWSHDQVLEQSLARLENLSILSHLLPIFYDIDNLDDLLHLECHIKQLRQCQKIDGRQYLALSAVFKDNWRQE